MPSLVHINCAPSLPYEYFGLNMSSFTFVGTDPSCLCFGLNISSCPFVGTEPVLLRSLVYIKGAPSVPCEHYGLHISSCPFVGTDPVLCCPPLSSCPPDPVLL